MADVNINKFRASVVRDGSKPASPGFIVSEGQSPTDPAGSGQNHLPVTIATAATGLAITDSQVLGGAGTVGQYIRGDGSLADFPQASGGGSSVSYYLNGSISQGTIGGVAYKELNKVPILGAGTDFTINADGYIASFLTDAGDPNLLEIPGGNWNFETYFSASSSGGTPTFYVELYKYDGTTFTLIASSSSSPELIAFGTNLNPYFSTLAVPTTTLALTDRLAVRYYVNHSGRTITLHTENNHLCQVVTTFTTGLTSLNGLTAQVQNLAVGTNGTDFNIASATATHTFNLPTASATNRGALSSPDWTTFNNKQNALGYVPVPETRTITINGVSQDLSANRTYNVGTVTSVGLSSATSGVTIGSTPVTTSGTITLAIATASGSQNGLLSSTDWTTFNNKQNALTNPVTGTGTTNTLPKFTGASTIGNSAITDDGTNLNLISRSIIIANSGLTAAYIGATSSQGFLNFYSGTSSGYNNGAGITLVSSDRSGAFTRGELYLEAGNASNNTSNGFIQMLTGNSPRVTITYGGNVLIGTTTDNGARLQVSGRAYINNVGGSVAGTTIYGNDQSNVRLRLENVNGRTWELTGGLTGANNSDFTIYDVTASATRMVITSSGNVGIGTTTPTDGRLVVEGADVNVTAKSTSNVSVFKLMNTSGTSVMAQVNNALVFEHLGSERMRITSGGNVLIGTTTDTGYKLKVQGSTLSEYISIENNSAPNVLLQCWNKSNSGDNKFVEFYTEGGGGTLRGSIDFNRGAGLTRYNTTSDYRLKTELEDFNANSIIKNLKPKKYRMLNASEKMIGFIAHELQEFYPQAVSGKKDQVNEYGLPIYQGIDYSQLTGLLVKAIQELKQEIDTLKN